MNLDEMAKKAYSEHITNKKNEQNKAEEKELNKKLEKIQKFKEYLSQYISLEIQRELKIEFNSSHEYHGYPVAEFSYFGVNFKLIQWNNQVKIVCSQKKIDDNISYDDLMKILLINFGDIQHKLSEYTVKIVIEHPVTAFDAVSALNLAVDEIEAQGHKVNYDDTFSI